MEYTKDMIFNVCYSEVHNVKKEKKRTSKIWKAVKKHKIMTMITFAAIIFISIDAVLVTNFFKILTVI